MSSASTTGGGTPLCVSPISNEGSRRDKIPIIWRMKSQRTSAGGCEDLIPIRMESQPFSDNAPSVSSRLAEAAPI